MNRLRHLTAGESHGPALVGILEGLPAGLALRAEHFDRDLARRQQGYGRGGRMRIEKDVVELLAGLRHGHTLGSPLSVLIRNLDFEKAWSERMSPHPGGPDSKPVTVPRPGHADLAGGLKYGHTDDLRNVLERASARETAMRVALGAAARQLLRELGIQVGSHVRAIGGAEALAVALPDDAEAMALQADASPVRTLDGDSTARLMAEVDAAQKRRDTLGGVIEVVATGVPVGLGSHVQLDRKLDGRLAGALMGLPAVKGVELGEGFLSARQFGSEVHDPIALEGGRLVRTRDRSGGTEGGITTGRPLVLRVAMKPIATVPAALPSVDLSTLEATAAHIERSDTCAVPALGVIAEAQLALVLADALLEALGGDAMAELRRGMARLRQLDRTHPGALFLLGPMGAGKSTVGPLVAQALDLPFVDLDQRVVMRAGAPIAALFEREGEAAFRQREFEALQEVVESGPSVVALGGGTVLHPGVFPLLRRHGVSVRLDVASEVALTRLLESPRGLASRPLLAGDDPLATLQRLSAERAETYGRADLSLDGTHLAPEAMAGAVLGLLQSIEGPLARVERHRV